MAEVRAVRGDEGGRRSLRRGVLPRESHDFPARFLATDALGIVERHRDGVMAGPAHEDVEGDALLHAPLDEEATEGMPKQVTIRLDTDPLQIRLQLVSSWLASDSAVELEGVSAVSSLQGVHWGLRY